MNNFQTRCVQAFYDLKSKDPNTVRIAIVQTPGLEGVAIETRKGDKVFYPLTAIMDPVERLLHRRPRIAA